MARRKHGGHRGLTLVELLTVALVLAVLSAVAIPLYISTRRSAAARACIANVSAIAAAESAWAVRSGDYTDQMTELVGAPEGLAAAPTCPLRLPDHANDYTLTLDASTGQLTIECSNKAEHAKVVGEETEYAKSLIKPAKEAIP